MPGSRSQAELSHQTKNVKVNANLSNTTVLDPCYDRGWDLEALAQLLEFLLVPLGWALSWSRFLQLPSVPNPQQKTTGTRKGGHDHENETESGT